MIKYLILFSLFFMTSCLSSQDEQKTVQQTTTTEQKKSVEVEKNKAHKITKPVQATASKPNVRYHKETARRPNDIDGDYPYDIDLKLADGKVIKSSELLADNGKPTVLLFWLTTCVPCRYELKAIHEKYEQWQKEADFNLYAISTDFPKNYEAFVKRVEESGWKWDAFNDVNREFRQIMPGELNGLPQTFLLDKKGNIAYHKRKYRSGDEDVLFEKVKELAMK